MRSLTFFILLIVCLQSHAVMTSYIVDWWAHRIPGNTDWTTMCRPVKHGPNLSWYNSILRSGNSNEESQNFAHENCFRTVALAEEQDVKRLEGQVASIKSESIGHCNMRVDQVRSDLEFQKQQTQALEDRITKKLSNHYAQIENLQKTSTKEQLKALIKEVIAESKMKKENSKEN